MSQFGDTVLVEGVMVLSENGTRKLIEVKHAASCQILRKAPVRGDLIFIDCDKYRGITRFLGTDGTSMDVQHCATPVPLAILRWPTEEQLSSYAREIERRIVDAPTDVLREIVRKRTQENK